MSRGLEEARAAHNASTPTAPEVGLRKAVEAIATYNGTPVSIENLRWAATHSALSGSWIFDVLTGLADALATHPSPPLPGQPGVAEVVQRDDLAEVVVRAGNALGYSFDREVEGWDIADEILESGWLRAYVAAEVARTLGGEA